MAQPIPTGIRNALGNVGDAWSTANHLLQGKGQSGAAMGGACWSTRPLAWVGRSTPPLAWTSIYIRRTSADGQRSVDAHLTGLSASSLYVLETSARKSSQNGRSAESI